MKKIPLPKGKWAIVDDEDYPYLSRFHWTYATEGYGVAKREFSVKKATLYLPMWKFVIPSENNKEVLYKNRNSLDCRKENLVLVPVYMAIHYAKKKTVGNAGTPTSKYKGVSYSAHYYGRKKWIWNIQKQGVAYRAHCLTEREAALRYNEKARELYGDLAYQNKIDETP